jgi:hypothetical protein
MSTPPVRAVQPVKNSTIWKMVAVSVVGGAILVHLSGGSGDSGPTAYEACEHFVKAQLVAPATASFGLIDQATDGAGQTVVNVSVDAENSFGAKIRGYYMCTMTEDDSHTWHSVDVQQMAG